MRQVADGHTVPFEEDEKDPSVWFLDHNYIEGMNDMFKKVNAREKLIGWYHSGPKLRASDLEINELFKRYTPHPLLVIVDVQPKDVGVPTDAYFAVEEIKDVSKERKTEYMLDNIADKRRMAQRHPRPSFTHQAPSRRKKRRRSVSSISCETSATSQSVPSPPASPHSSSLSKACISGYKTSAAICRRFWTATYPSTTPSSATFKTSSTSSRTSAHPKHLRKTCLR